MSELPSTGDPFALSYARSGDGLRAAEIAEKRIREADAVVARSREEPHKRYGLPAVGGECPPGPESAIQDCLRAAQGILEDTIQIHSAVPWAAPPFRARHRLEHIQTILSTDAGTDAGTNAGGVLMLAANTVAGTPAYAPTLQEMTSALGFLEIFRLEPPQGYMARIKTWGIGYGLAGPASTLLQLKASTVAAAAPPPPNPFVSSFQADLQEDTFVILHPGQKLVIEARLRDITAGPVMIDFGILYWTWPINKRTDSPEGAILRAGYKADCP